MNRVLKILGVGFFAAVTVLLLSSAPSFPHLADTQTDLNQLSTGSAHLLAAQPLSLEIEHLFNLESEEDKFDSFLNPPKKYTPSYRKKPCIFFANFLDELSSRQGHHFGRSPPTSLLS